jgi:4'-phosphopantetheinyl transferase
MVWMAPADVPRLGVSTCQVWWATLRLGRSWDERSWQVQLLSPVERTRRDALRHPDDRLRFTIGVALSRVVLGGQLDRAPEALAIDRRCRQCEHPHGKPELLDASADLCFSVSHSGDWIVVAVTSGGAVGVDVEQRGRPRDLLGVARLVLSAGERAVLDGCPPDARACGFLRYWTRKEAIVKATGDGLTAPLPGLTVSPPAVPARLVAWEDRPNLVARVTLRDLQPGDGYIASLALLDHPEVTVTELDATCVLS